LRQVFAFLGGQNFSSEVVVVENASQDHTLDVALALVDEHPSLRVLHEDLPGKGRAVQRGMLAARGRYRFFADADFSMPVDQINRFLPPACQADIAIASREVSGSVRYGEPPLRHLTGRIFNSLIHWLALPGLKDTQCGFKCFRAGIVEELFSRQTRMGWSFDVELLYIARRRGFSVQEIGVPWTYDPGSRINVLQDSGRMFIDLLVIRRNARHGCYEA
jgi:glycosyltransferase involved in cell wall biosynthesis